jgi:hypothetical protein
MATKRPPFDADQAIEDYISGMSENATAIKHGISRTLMRTVLLERDIAPRGRSEAETIKWSRMGEAKRRAQVKAAHQASRGRRASAEELIRKAQSKQDTRGASHYELTLAAWLHERGLAPIQQLAIGPYNCDLAIHPVAVEVWGGGWHFTGRHAARTQERFHYIMNAGWHVLAVAVDSRCRPLVPQIADYIVAQVQQMRSNETAIRQYRVVWGAGEFTTGGSAQDNHFSIEPPFTNSRNPVNGQYQRVAR